MIHKTYFFFKWRSYLVYDLKWWFPYNVCILSITVPLIYYFWTYQTDRSIEFQGTLPGVVSGFRTCPNFSRSWLIKIAIVLFVDKADSLRMAWLIIRACKPTWLSQSYRFLRGTKSAAGRWQLINCRVNQFPCSNLTTESGWDSNSSIFSAVLVEMDQSVCAQQRLQYRPLCAWRATAWRTWSSYQDSGP